MPISGSQINSRDDVADAYPIDFEREVEMEMTFANPAENTLISPNDEDDEDIIPFAKKVPPPPHWRITHAWESINTNFNIILHLRQYLIN